MFFRKPDSDPNSAVFKAQATLFSSSLFLRFQARFPLDKNQTIDMNSSPEKLEYDAWQRVVRHWPGDINLAPKPILAAIRLWGEQLSQLRALQAPSVREKELSHAASKYNLAVNPQHDLEDLLRALGEWAACNGEPQRKNLLSNFRRIQAKKQ